MLHFFMTWIILLSPDPVVEIKISLRYQRISTRYRFEKGTRQITGGVALAFTAIAAS